MSCYPHDNHRNTRVQSYCGYGGIKNIAVLLFYIIIPKYGKLESKSVFKNENIFTVNMFEFGGLLLREGSTYTPTTYSTDSATL